MEKEKKDEEKGVTRRNFLKKMVYVSPVIATLIIPNYVKGMPSCSNKTCKSYVAAARKSESKYRSLLRSERGTKPERNNRKR
jgi:hypothetical protein